MSDPGEPTVSELIAKLDHHDMGTSEEARLDLEAMGSRIVGPLISALADLGPRGQLQAIEVFESVGDVRAGPALIDLLESDEDVVREWAASALGELAITRAIPHLQRAYRATRERGIPPDWTEPVAIRRALTRLRARQPVVPPLTESVEHQVSNLGRAFPVEHLASVIEDLRRHGQAVLYFQIWRMKNGNFYWTDQSGSWEGDLDYSDSWMDLVQKATERALTAASRVTSIPEAVATIEWIDHTDL